MTPSAGWVALLLLVGGSGPVAAQAPGTDVWVVPLGVRSGALTLAAPRNVTARAGYDNQPSWTRAGDAIFYTSNRDGAQTDIFRYELATGRTTAVTTTPESEYSATLMPTGQAVSVIRVELDSAQRLWSIPLGAGAPSVILPALRPVGYHAWADDYTLGLFVLGSPATFQVADIRTQQVRIVGRGIGRGIAKAPGERRISFIEKWSADAWWILSYDVTAQELHRVAPTLPGIEDFAWTPSGVLLMARESGIHAWNPDRRTWELVGDLAAAGVQGITRLAVSPRGDYLAFVARDAAR
jgi:hypothetical protein